MLARMGAALALEPQAPHQQSFHDLKELLAARRALIKDRTAAKIRRSTAQLALIKRQLDARLKRVEDETKKILARSSASSGGIGTPLDNSVFARDATHP